MTQKQNASKLGFSDSTLKQYWKDIQLQSPYINAPTNHKRSQMLSSDLKRTEMISKKSVVDSP